MTNHEKAANLLLLAVEQVLGVADDGGGMEWIDWDLLRRAKAVSRAVGVRPSDTPMDK